MSDFKLTLLYDWVSADLVGLDDSKRLVFPTTPQKPGLYMFQFALEGVAFAYIGETDRLHRRLQHYRTPSPSQHTNLRLNGLFCEVIKKRNPISLAIVTEGAYLEVDADHSPADFAQKADRVLFEHAAIYLTRMSGTNLLNLSVPAA